MTENDTETKTDDAPDDAPDDQPPIEDGEMADWGEVAEEIEEAEENADEDGGDDEQDDDEPDEQGAEVPNGVSLGDVYCNALGMGAAVGRSRYGSADADERDDLMDEYGDLARQLQIDEYVDEWMAENGGMDSLSPGQAILLSTFIFAGAVGMDDPEMVDGIVEEVGDS